jgi:hypothetical protein
MAGMAGMARASRNSMPGAFFGFSSKKKLMEKFFLLETPISSKKCMKHENILP